jgi:glyoxylase-like metal-dependent hydrolase (beta-lactamase superfamily II)
MAPWASYGPDSGTGARRTRSGGRASRGTRSSPPEQVGEGSPDVAWLLREKIGEARPYAAGDRLDVGVEAFPGQKPNDMVLWVVSHRAVVVGDTLPDFRSGLHIDPRWLGPDVTRDQVVEGLRPLLELPVEHVLATHGGPYDRAALERALSG